MSPVIEFPAYVSVDDALRHILSICPRLPTERVSPGDGAERVLATDVVAPISLPAFANAAMDGFAVRSEDVTADNALAGPAPAACSLRVIGESVAGGGVAGRVEPGTTVRIMTGAMVPLGADAVVPIEETTPGEKGCILVQPHSARAGRYIRQVGEDVSAGEIILRAGRVLAPQDIGLLAMPGVEKVAVVRRPRVAILATGDEVVPADAPIEPGQVRNANTPMLAALINRYGGIPLTLGIAHDTEASLVRWLQEAFALAPDLILTTAGVSVGDYDLVKTVLDKMGTIVFWKVQMKPGKPLVAGLLHGPESGKQRVVPMLGLPGNPFSAFVSSEVFVRAALLHMQGRQPVLPRIQARLDEDVKGTNRRAYIPVRVSLAEQGYGVALCGAGRGSHAMSRLVEANGLLAVPAQSSYHTGETVEVLLLTRWEEGSLV
jgi:molybdopterin molybdotransferase